MIKQVGWSGEEKMGNGIALNMHLEGSYFFKKFFAAQPRWAALLGREMRGGNRNKRWEAWREEMGKSQSCIKMVAAQKSLHKPVKIL